MKPGVLILIIIFCLGWAIQASARPQNRYDENSKTCRILGEGPLEWESSSWGQGGKIFKNLCQGCHSRNNDHGAPFLWVESKRSDAWNRVFTKKYPKCAKDGSWASMSPEQERMVNDYLFRWGKDSQTMDDNC